MADFNSALPIRTELAGQAVYEDVIVKIGDPTNPTTQQAVVDTFGSLQSRIADASGNVIASQALSASNWLQIVSPSNGPAAPGTVAAFSNLIGGQYNATLPTVADTQQVAVQVDSHGRLWSNVTNLPSTVDTNYGVVGANTIRTASEIGNATGSADFNYGAIGAQSLRTAAQLGNATGAVDYNFGAASAQTLRAAALIGNATGAADFNYGVIGAQSLRVASQIGNATGSADFNYGAVGAQTVRTASQIGNATGAADFNNGATGAQTLRVAANLAVAGANVSSTNPVPVTVVNTTLGTEVNKYNTTASLAAGASTNHDYAITATKTFKGKKFWISGSGKVKAEVQTSPDGTTFTTYWVGFNSTATPNIDIELDLLTITDSGAGSKVRIIVTNKDNQAQDVYSTISGSEY